MKCLVTGATGFLGTNLVHELVKAGWQVKAFGLPGSNVDYLKELPIEILFGDITVPEDVDAAVSGCDIVFHVAGDTSWWKKNFDRQRKINVDGAVNVAKACIKNNVKRLVHTSTIDVFGYNPNGQTNEDWKEYNFEGTGNNYADTKREGEAQLMKYNGDDLEIVVIYPGSMMGPFDHTLQYGRLFFELRDGKVPGCPKGGVSFGHVTEVAKAHIKAAEIGKPGEGYICAGVDISYKGLFEIIAKKFNKSAPKITFPRKMIIMYGQVLEWISYITNKPPEIDPGIARCVSVNVFANSSKAVRELDYKIISVEQMVDDAYNWYDENGYL